MYSFTSKVRYSECDANLVLGIPALINYLQDCSTFHTESIGRGFQYCAQYHFAWYVAAWQVQIERLPRFTEEIEVITWCYAKSPVLTNRCFELQGPDQETLVRADSLWFPFDTRANRPMRIPQSEMGYLSDDRTSDLPPTRRKIKLAGEGRPCEAIVVSDHHLDTNRHVNNGQYIAMADAVVRDVQEGFDLYRLSVQYKNAAKLGDVIVPYLYTEDRGYAVDLTAQSGDSYAVVRMECR